jgi:hypothetical protein
MSLNLLSAYSSSDEEDDSDSESAKPSPTQEVSSSSRLQPTPCDNPDLKDKENSDLRLGSVTGKVTKTRPVLSSSLDQLEVGPRRKFFNPRLNICPPPDQEPVLQPYNLTPTTPEKVLEPEPVQDQEPEQDEELHPYYDTDFLIPGRNQIIPGKFLRPPEAAAPAVYQEDEEEEEKD